MKNELCKAQKNFQDALDRWHGAEKRRADLAVEVQSVEQQLAGLREERRSLLASPTPLSERLKANKTAIDDTGTALADVTTAQEVHGAALLEAADAARAAHGALETAVRETARHRYNALKARLRELAGPMIGECMALSVVALGHGGLTAKSIVEDTGLIYAEPADRPADLVTPRLPPLPTRPEPVRQPHIGTIDFSGANTTAQERAAVHRAREEADRQAVRDYNYGQPIQQPAL